ncbi:hypothetical protein QCM77_23940 [Bradyrhizobium sp. SSUT18]|uniref:hypothetical protein n=1 Tax=Bradyrhizobium sp. SSUT18 TaxID=3040602 RepID=UPI00244CFBBB|nr:hypothetical protein [Bradyrhizobium sp. SSUT18]MDH2402984.1 hypothetical protein [Bradyrhizobium sp. SSUT18]
MPILTDEEDLAIQAKLNFILGAKPYDAPPGLSLRGIVRRRRDRLRQERVDGRRDKRRIQHADRDRGRERSQATCGDALVLHCRKSRR